MLHRYVPAAITAGPMSDGHEPFPASGSARSQCVRRTPESARRTGFRADTHI